MAALLICVGLLGVASTSEAQSGRKPSKRPASPDPLPPKQAEPPIQPSAKVTDSRIPLTITWGLRSVGDSTIYARMVADGCLEQLSKSRSVKPNSALEMNRKEAHDLAKRSSSNYVLWFELDVDLAIRDRTGNIGMGQALFVVYEVFTPGTGKRKAAGRIYQRPVGPGGVSLPVPAPRTPGAGEYSLRNAGREMADRLLSALGLPRV